MDEYLNLAEAARHLGIGRVTLYKLIHASKLPTFQSKLNWAVRLVRLRSLATLN